MSVHDRYTKFVADQREFFNTLIVEDWDTYHSPQWDMMRRYEIAKLFDIIQPETVLDIGCGCGFHDKEMATYSFVKEIHAIDYSDKSIETANREYPDPKVKRSTSDLRELSEVTYDLVVSWHVFEHLDDPDAYFESALRVAKDGGWIAIFTPNRMRLPNVKRILKSLPVEYLDPQHFYEYTAKEIVKLGKTHGLEHITSFGYGFSGLSFIDNLSMERRLKLGRCFRAVADNICIVFEK